MATLKEIRNLMGYTQQGLSDKLGMSLRYYQNIEGGFRNASAPKIREKLEGLYGITLEQIEQIDLSSYTNPADFTEDLQTGSITLEDIWKSTKELSARSFSSIGKNPESWKEAVKWIPEDIKSGLSAKQIGQLADAFYQCYSAGKAER